MEIVRHLAHSYKLDFREPRVARGQSGVLIFYPASARVLIPYNPALCSSLSNVSRHARKLYVKSE